MRISRLVGTKFERFALSRGPGSSADELRMATGDYYLALALELLARAETEHNPEKRAGLEALAASYRRMAEQIVAGLTVEFELPPEREDDHSGK